jgi:hypothetical protein
MELLHSIQHEAEKSNGHVEVLFPEEAKFLGEHDLSTCIA